MTRTTSLAAALLGLALAGCSIDTGAPSTVGIGRYILTGRVTNLTGTNLQNVTVQAQPVGGGLPARNMITNSAGIYRSAGMAAGTYRVVVVMGDSSRITETGRVELFVGNADSTIARTLTYDPGRVISGSLTYAVQDTMVARSIAFRGVMVRLSLQATPAVFIDSIRTSATGAFRFAVRTGSTTCPAGAGCYRVTVDTTGFRALTPLVIPNTALVNFLNVSAGSSANVTSTVSGSITYRAPFFIQGRIFKDKNADAVFNTGDSVISGIRVWLRRNGGTINLGSSPATSSTGTTATGNFSFTGLDSAVTDGWSMHVVRWYLPAGCLLAKDASNVEIVDYPVSGYRTGAVTKDIPVTGC